MTTYKIATILIVSWSLVTYSVGPPCVYEKGGNIYLKQSSGETVLLTSNGHDYHPSLAGSLVVFYRRDPEDMFRSFVYSVDLESKNEKLLFPGPVIYLGSRIGNLARPEIDPRTQTLYVVGMDSVTTGQLFRVDLRTSTFKWVAHAADFRLVHSGPRAGELLVYQREHRPGEVYYDWWYYSPAGKRFAFAGPDDSEVEPRECTEWK
jgi:hypothetical protein